jgi:hypothetical protein
MLEMLSDIYYRIHFFYETVSGGASIAGKIVVQVDAKRDARSFWWGGWVVGFAGLTKPNYKPTMGGRCIETLEAVMHYINAASPNPSKIRRHQHPRFPFLS